jgi:hypothetical protein
MNAKWITWLLLLVCITNNIQCQENTYFVGEDATGSAFEQSSYTAHWSAYIPITLLIAAGIYFGIADQNDSSCSSSSGYGRKNGLGCLRDGKNSSSYSNSHY